MTPSGTITGNTAKHLAYGERCKDFSIRFLLLVDSVGLSLGIVCGEGQGAALLHILIWFDFEFNADTFERQRLMMLLTAFIIPVLHLPYPT